MVKVQVFSGSRRAFSHGEFATIVVWVVQWVMHPILDLRSGLDLRVEISSPMLGSTLGMETTLKKIIIITPIVHKTSQLFQKLNRKKGNTSEFILQSRRYYATKDTQKHHKTKESQINIPYTESNIPDKRLVYRIQWDYLL